MTLHPLLNHMCYAIWYHLSNFKNMENTHGGVLLLVKLQAEFSNFTKSNTLPWVFFTFLNCTNGTKLRKTSQMGALNNAGLEVVTPSVNDAIFYEDPPILPTPPARLNFCPMPPLLPHCFLVCFCLITPDLICYFA